MTSKRLAWRVWPVHSVRTLPSPAHSLCDAHTFWHKARFEAGTEVRGCSSEAILKRYLAERTALQNNYNKLDASSVAMNTACCFGMGILDSFELHRMRSPKTIAFASCRPRGQSNAHNWQEISEYAVKKIFLEDNLCIKPEDENKNVNSISLAPITRNKDQKLSDLLLKGRLGVAASTRRFQLDNRPLWPALSVQVLEEA